MKLKILLIVICLILIGIGSCWFVEDTFFMVKQDPVELDGNELQVEVHKLLSSYIKTVDLSEMDLSKPGEHEIVVSEDYLWVHREETYIVITKDVTPPVITLNGEKTICFEVGMEFVDPGVSVSDDSGEECILETSFEGDMNTPGIYRCVYKATDSSGNVSYNNIDVAVGEGLNPDVVNSAYFELPTEYEFYTENYLFDEILFIGDSNIREMSYSHYLNSGNCVSAPALMPPEFYFRLCTYKEYENIIKPYDAVIELMPNYLAIEWGIINVEAGGLAKFIENYNEVIKSIREIKEDCEIYLISILPVVPVEGSSKPSNGAINIYNYYVKQLADKEDCYFINVAEVLKDEWGNANPSYYEEDGYHLNEAGRQVFVDYVKNRVPAINKHVEEELEEEVEE